MWAPFPIRAIDERVQRRRIKHLAEISRFAVWVEEVKEPQYVLGSWVVNQPQHLLGIWEGRDTWRPIDGLSIHFVFPNALDLPPGKYEVTVYHCADPPWGWGGVRQPCATSQQR